MYNCALICQQFVTHSAWSMKTCVAWGKSWGLPKYTEFIHRKNKLKCVPIPPVVVEQTKSHIYIIKMWNVENIYKALAIIHAVLLWGSNVASGYVMSELWAIIWPLKWSVVRLLEGSTGRVFKIRVHPDAWGDVNTTYRAVQASTTPHCLLLPVLFCLPCIMFTVFLPWDQSQKQLKCHNTSKLWGPPKSRLAIVLECVVSAWKIKPPRAYQP